MQNKPNFLDAQMNVTSLITVEYENIANSKLRENKPNSKPIKANLLDAQMNITSVLTKDYENKPRLPAQGKQTQSNPIANPTDQTILQETGKSGSIITIVRVDAFQQLRHLCRPCQEVGG